MARFSGDVGMINIEIIKNRVLEALVKNGTWMTVAQVKEESGLPSKQVSRALRHLVRSKLVKRNRYVKDARAWIYTALALPIKLHKQIVEEISGKTLGVSEQ